MCENLTQERRQSFSHQELLVSNYDEYNFSHVMAKYKAFLPANKKLTRHLKKKSQILLKHRIIANVPAIFRENLVLPPFPSKIR
jgi:hypothetical protein